jgi:transcriptional regulator with XRE-family HTH domain
LLSYIGKCNKLIDRIQVAARERLACDAIISRARGAGGRMGGRRADGNDVIVGRNIRVHRLARKMSQSGLAAAIGLTFQQVQKYEKGTNRISASRLQQLAQILQVPAPFFFEGAPSAPGGPHVRDAAPSPAFVTDFLATSDGLALVKAFMRIKQPKLRRHIVDMSRRLLTRILLRTANEDRGMNATRAVRLLAYWKIYRSNEKRERATFGTVEAVDADSAIKTAIERFKITDPEQQKRLVARRLRGK